ncbi:universal stress protein [Azospirillum sp.]|uniref:universal stress protein n=1 Tax=Azospirillum sp. TaxID=34012 RepID=UPI003D70FE84
MVKHILVPLDGTSSDERALAAPFDLAGLFTAHVDLLHTHPDPREMILGGATRHRLGTPLACSVVLAH